MDCIRKEQRPTIESDPQITAVEVRGIRLLTTQTLGNVVIGGLLRPHIFFVGKRMTIFNNRTWWLHNLHWNLTFDPHHTSADVNYSWVMTHLTHLTHPPHLGLGNIRRKFHKSWPPPLPPGPCNAHTACLGQSQPIDHHSRWFAGSPNQHLARWAVGCHNPPGQFRSVIEILICFPWNPKFSNFPKLWSKFPSFLPSSQVLQVEISQMSNPSPTRVLMPKRSMAVEMECFTGLPASKNKKTQGFVGFLCLKICVFLA